MSVHGDITIVNDEEMSSEGSVHSPLAVSSTGMPAQSPAVQQAILAIGSPLRPQSPVFRVVPPSQSSWFGTPSAFATTVPVATASGSVRIVVPTEPVEVPSLQDTKVAFNVVSLAFRDMSAKHGQIQGNIQVLASTVEALHQAK